MTYLPDLAPCTYISADVELVAIGWLGGEQPHAQGPVMPGVVERLFDRIETIFDPRRFRGSHKCELCGEAIQEMHDSEGRVVAVGATNLYIPRLGADGLFAAPSLILHYVVDHGYRPPEPFQAALLACPESQIDFLRALEPRIPDAWKDGLFGYWVALGQALSSEAGLMDNAAWGSLFERCVTLGKLGDEDDAPAWFHADHLVPIHALAAEFREQGKSWQAQAVLAWHETLECIGCCLPPQRLQDRR